MYQTLVSGVALYKHIENSGQLQIETGLTQCEIAQQRDEFAENIRVFHEVIDIEHALNQQTVAVIDPKYL